MTEEIYILGIEKKLPGSSLKMSTSILFNVALHPEISAILFRREPPATVAVALDVLGFHSTGWNQTLYVSYKGIDIKEIESSIGKAMLVPGVYTGSVVE